MLASIRGGGLGDDDDSNSGSGEGGDSDNNTSVDVISSLLMQGAAINAQTDRTGKRIILCFCALFFFSFFLRILHCKNCVNYIIIVYVKR